MKKYLQIFAIFIAATTLASCDPNGNLNGGGSSHHGKPGPYDFVENGINLGQGIPILGDWDGDASTPNTTLYWAPVNCGYEEKGELKTAYDHRFGKLYQWGAEDSSLPYYYYGEQVIACEKYYETTPSPWYGSDVIRGFDNDTWNKNQGPCPDGWRLPTSNEFSILCRNSTWMPAGAYAGESDVYPGYEFFGENVHKTPGTGVFFPAAGLHRTGADSTYVGASKSRCTVGLYWSSTLHPYSIPYYLYFSSSKLWPTGELNNRQYPRSYAFSVRCVKGEGDPQGELFHAPESVILTTSVVDIQLLSAVCGGNITSVGDAPITECGVCYSEATSRTFNNKVVSQSCSLGPFTCDLSDLAENTKYYVRAYAKNANGIYYGNLETFTTKMLPLGPDYIEGGVNLGHSISILGDWDRDASTPNSMLYWAPVNCGYEEKGTVNSDSDHRLGKLYQWGAGDSSLPYKYNGSPVVAREMYYDSSTPSPWYDYNTIVGTTSDKWKGNQGPCPEGWRLPTSQEFIVLCAGKNERGGLVSAGTYAGQANTYPGAEFFGANADKTPGTGVFFPAAGFRSANRGTAGDRGPDGYYWSSTDSSDSRAYCLYFHASNLFSNSSAPQHDNHRACAQSVRCVSGDGDPNGEVQETLGPLTWTNGTNAYSDGVASINGQKDVNVYKLGTSKAGGNAIVTVPSGVNRIGFYAIGWWDVPAGTILNVGDKAVVVSANTSVTGNSPYTITIENLTAIYFTVDVSAGDVKVSCDKRVLIWDLKAVE